MVEQSVSPNPAFGRELRLRTWGICLLLALVVLAAYSGVTGCGFVSLDDPEYVVRQPMVRYGFRGAAFEWLLTAAHGGNWHPLTTISHLADCTFFGLNPWPMHVENVLLHLAACLLLFLLWRQLTGRRWTSAFLAAALALHPVHVESVAWISERKDVLCGVCWLAGLLAYAAWVRRPARWRAAVVLSLASLALLAKPMAVTFPITLLLLDYWPLRRWPACSWSRLLVEKIPLFLLSGALAAITFLVQGAAGATSFGASLSFGQRAGNAVVSCARYLGKTFWPEPLSVFYPHPGWWPWSVVLGAMALVLALTIFAWREAGRRPWLLFGWLWFLLTLLPTLGLVQVGAQAMADRYLYLPQIGLLAAVAMTLEEWSRRSSFARQAVVSVAALTLAACAVLTFRAVPVWRNGVTLFEQAVAVYPVSARAQLLLGSAGEYAGHPLAEVEAHFRQAVALDPRDGEALMELARMQARQSHFAEALALLQCARPLRPADPFLEHALGICEAALGREPEAIKHFQEAIKLQPRASVPRRELARLAARHGEWDKASRYLWAATVADRWDALNFARLGEALAQQGEVEAAKSNLRQALWIDPGVPEAREALARLP